MNVPCAGYDQDPPLDLFRPHRFLKLHRHAARHELVLLPVDDERRRRVFPSLQLRQRVHGRDSIRTGIALPVVARHAIEQDIKGVSFFEEAQNQFGAWVTWPNPAKAAFIGSATAVARNLNGGLGID